MQTVILNSKPQRDAARHLIDCAPVGAIVTVREAVRSPEQNKIFHAICSEIARSPVQWAGKRRNAEEWKVLLVSGHTKATDGEVELVPGLEGEFVNIRESTARMNKARASSLIEYTLAWCANHGIELTNPNMEQAA